MEHLKFTITSNKMVIIRIERVQIIFDLITFLFNIFEENDVDFIEVFEFIKELAKNKNNNLPEVFEKIL